MDGEKSCDVALTEILNSEQCSISNEVTDSVGNRYTLHIFNGQARELEESQCFKYETNFDLLPGVIKDLTFFFRNINKLVFIENCIAVVNSSGTDQHFITDAECGKIVFVIKEGRACGIGVVFGELAIQTTNGSVRYTLLSDLPWALAKLKTHQYCRGGLNLWT